MPSSTNAPKKAPASTTSRPKPHAIAKDGVAPKPTSAPARQTRAAGRSNDTGAKQPEPEPVPEPVKKKRRSKAEMEADKKAVAEAKTAKLAKQAAGLKAVADMENKLARQDANLVTPRNASRGQPSVAVKSSHYEDRSESELTETLPSDNDPDPPSEFQDLYEPAQTEQVQDSDTEPPAMKKGKGISKVSDRAADSGEEEMFNLELTPVVKRKTAVKGKAVGGRGAINELRVAGDAETDQKSVREPSDGPKIKTGAIDRWNNAVSTFGARSRPGSKASTTIAASTVSKTSSAAKRFVAPSALTSNIQIQSSYPVKTEDREVDFGGVSDADETQGPEREAAASSPMKGNTRKDSDDIIVIDDTPPPVRIQPRKKNRGESSSSKFTNENLPVGCMNDGAWLKTFIPTLVLFICTLDNPWAVEDVVMKKALQAIFKTVYKGKVDHTVMVSDAVWHVSAQRLNEFRSKIGSAGLAIVNSLLDSENGLDIHPSELLFDTDTKRRQYCQDLLEDEQFAYAQYESPTKKNGVFGGPLIVRTLAAYCLSTEGAVKVSALKDLAGAHAFGALGLCTASVRRALSLWADGAITIAIWEDAKSNNRGEILNKNFYRTFDNKDAKLKFEELAFGGETGDYAEDAMDISTEDLNAIFTKAKELAKESRNGGSRSSRRTENTADDARPLKRRRLGNVNEDAS